jgi:hypothetical protein
VASSSFVLVFARLAARDIMGAKANVAALAMVCFLFVSALGAANGGWRHSEFWAALFVLAACSGLRQRSHFAGPGAGYAGGVPPKGSTGTARALFRVRDRRVHQ